MAQNIQTPINTLKFLAKDANCAVRAAAQANLGIIWFMFYYFKPFKILISNIIILITVCFYNIYPAYAQNNSLALGTLIVTSNGNIAIEKLHSGDRIVGYNFATHQQQTNHIKEISYTSSLSYYLINNEIKITGTSYVYVKTSNNPKIIRVYQIKEQDRLIGQNYQNYVVNQIKQIIKPLKFYRITLEETNNNFFTANFLVYPENNIPKNFQENFRHINCGIGAPYQNYRSRECIESYLAFPASFIALVFLIVGLILSTKIVDRFYSK